MYHHSWPIRCGLGTAVFTIRNVTSSFLFPKHDNVVSYYNTCRSCDAYFAERSKASEIIVSSWIARICAGVIRLMLVLLGQTKTFKLHEMGLNEQENTNSHPTTIFCLKIGSQLDTASVCFWIVKKVAVTVRVDVIRERWRVPANISYSTTRSRNRALILQQASSRDSRPYLGKMRSW